MHILPQKNSTKTWPKNDPKWPKMAQQWPKIAQKWAPVEKNSTDISAASATFCISAHLWSALATLYDRACWLLSWAAGEALDDFKKSAHCLVQRLILCKTRVGVKHCIMLCKNRIPHFINPAEGSFQAHHNGPLMSGELLMWFVLVRFPNLYFDTIQLGSQPRFFLPL